EKKVAMRPARRACIRSVPLATEVLCHIFIHCLPQTDYMLPNSKSPPMLLTRICRRWREVAVDMPLLW
ncbi:hypothetical protein EV424DRAFT_1280114, partial [Suillus variegatus]